MISHTVDNEIMYWSSTVTCTNMLKFLVVLPGTLLTLMPRTLNSMESNVGWQTLKAKPKMNSPERWNSDVGLLDPKLEQVSY